MHFLPHFHANTIDYEFFWPNFHPNTMNYVFWFHDITIHYGFCLNFISSKHY